MQRLVSNDGPFLVSTKTIEIDILIILALLFRYNNN